MDQQHTAQIISVLVDLFNCEFLSVRRKSDEVLRALIEVADPIQLFLIFQKIILQNKDVKQKIINVNASIRLVTYVVRKIPSKQQLIKLLPTFVQAVVDEFSSDDINVRKTAVSCFIDLFMVVGHEF